MSRLICCMMVFLLTNISCSVYHIDSQDISTDYFPCKVSANDVIYLDKINKPYRLIGHVTVNTERRQKINDVIDKMKREAAIMGGDAITNIKTDATGIWKKLPAQKLIGNAYLRANFTADVIVFK